MQKRYSLVLMLACWLALLHPASAQRDGVVTNAGPGGGTPVLAEESPYSHLVDSLLAPLTKSQIPTGILYDRAMPLAVLHAFSSGTRVDTSSNAHWRQAQLELYMSAYARTALLTPAQVREKAGHWVRRDSIPLGVLDYEFNYLDSLAVESNLLREQGGLYYDVAGRPRSPYLTRRLTLAAPLADTSARSARFYVPATLLLGNRARRVSSLLIDFDNQGAARLLLPGQTTLVSYGTAGRKVLAFTVQFTDGTQAQCRARLEVRDFGPASRSETYRLADVDARVPFRDYISSRSLYGKAEVLLAYQNPQTLAELDAGGGGAARLRHPVIVLDGFDPEDRSHLENQGPDEDEPIYDLLFRIGITTALEALQRDLVIVNFPYSQRQMEGGGTTAEDVDGGADYVERNAMALVEVINQLKGRLADPAEKFTVIGPSMGGLVSRYALAYMERQQQLGAAVPAGASSTYWDHQTATWIAFDTPNQGANVPVGDQEFLNYYKNATPVAEKNLNAKVNSPAARQLLVQHYSGGVAPNGAPAFHTRFYQALNSNGETGSFGYPVHVRRVALVNGRLDGQRPGADGTPCGYAFQENMVIRSTWLRFPTIYSAAFFRRVPAGILSAADARFSPDANTACRVFQGQVTLEVSGFKHVPLTKSRWVDFGPANSYDLAPGGLYNSQQQLVDQSETADNKEFYDMYFFNVKPNHTFIPTVSALGFGYRTLSNYQGTGSLPNPYSSLTGRDLTCADEIPFDSYYGPAHANTQHIRGLTADMQQFLLRELSLRTAKPALTSGLENLAMCINGSPLPVTVKTECRLRAGQPATTYRWVLSGPVRRDLSLPADGAAQRLIYDATVSSNPEAFATVYATRPGLAESAPLVLGLYVDNNNLVIGTNTCGWQPGQIMCQGVTVHLGAASSIGDASSIRWYANGAQINSLNGVAEGGYSLPSPGSGSYTVVIFADIDDPCNPGTRLRSDNELQFRVGGYGCTACREAAPAPEAEPRPVAALYPNPADGEVLLTPAVDTIPTKAAGFQTTIYDWQGHVVLEQASAQPTLRLRTAAWRPGLYQVVLRQGSRVIRQQLSIQH